MNNAQMKGMRMMADVVKKEEESLDCSICGDKILPNPISGWAFGNNAEPINSGRCCEVCDVTVVIPKRIAIMCNRRKHGDQ